MPTTWLATLSVWLRSSSASVLCQPVWPPVEHTCVKKHRYILAFYRHSDGSEEEKVGCYIFCFSQIWFHLWSPLEHWHSWRQSWVSYSTAPAMRRRPRSSGWRVEIKNRSEFFRRPALGWRLARRGWGHHRHRQELLAPRKICRKDPGRQAGKENIFASIFCLMSSTDTSWQNRIQNGYIYLPIPSELVDDHSLVVDSNWQFSAHNPTCAWPCGQNCSTLVHKVD